MTTEIKILEDSVPTSKKEHCDNEDYAEVTHCPACNDRRYLQDMARVEGQSQTGIILSICTQCMHIFQRRRPDHDWVLKFYRESWMHERKSDKEKLSYKVKRGVKRKLKKIVGPWRPGYKVTRAHMIFNLCHLIDGGPKTPKGMDILDVGCGDGQLIEWFWSNGARICGIDQSAHRVNTSSMDGVEVKNIPLEELDQSSFNRKFDLIIIDHVLEHILDPVIFFEACEKLLNKDGLVVVAVPNAKQSPIFEMAHFMPHPHWFTTQSLETLADRQNFKAAINQCGEEIISIFMRKKDLKKHSLRSQPSKVKNDADALCQSLVKDIDIKNGEYTLSFWRGSSEYVAGRHMDDWQPSSANLNRPRRKFFVELVTSNSKDKLPLHFIYRGAKAPFWIK